MTKPEALFSKLSLRAAALAVLGLALSACDTPTSPQETAERVANALMKGSEEELSPLLNPESEAAKLSARKIRIHYQGFAFRPADEASKDAEPAAPEGVTRTGWDIEASIAGTDRHRPAAHLTIDCREEPRRHCLVSNYKDLAPTFTELTSVNDELGDTDTSPRVWLMTSLDVLDPRINLFTGRNHQALARAEELFQEWAKNEVPEARARVAHLANQHDLARVLLDSRTLAVFWISHGTVGKIIDAQGFEVAPVFSTLAPHSSARRIALISCQSHGIIDSDPRVIDFDEKIDLTRALEESLKRTSSKDIAATSVNARERPGSDGEVVNLVRKVRAFDPHTERASVMPAVRIETAADLLATLPAVRNAREDETQSIEIRIPLIATRFILTSGESYTTPLTEIDLGQWEILTPGWKFFADANGKPIGVTRNIVLRNPKP